MSSAIYNHPLLTKQREWTIYPTGYGHYAWGSPDGEELCDGQAVEALLGAVWIPGFIKLEQSGDDIFVAMADQTVCGLCGGMKIRPRDQVSTIGHQGENRRKHQEIMSPKVRRAQNNGRP